MKVEVMGSCCYVKREKGDKPPKDESHLLYQVKTELPRYRRNSSRNGIMAVVGTTRGQKPKTCGTGPSKHSWRTNEP